MYIKSHTHTQETLAQFDRRLLIKLYFQEAAYIVI